LHRLAFTGAFGGHLVKWPFASRHGAANADVESMATATAAAKTIRIFSLPLLNRSEDAEALLSLQANNGLTVTGTRPSHTVAKRNPTLPRLWLQ
jgi:hypothetical protein